MRAKNLSNGAAVLLAFDAAIPLQTTGHGIGDQKHPMSRAAFATKRLHQRAQLAGFIHRQVVQRATGEQDGRMAFDIGSKDRIDRVHAFVLSNAGWLSR